MIHIMVNNILCDSDYLLILFHTLKIDFKQPIF